MVLLEQPLQPTNAARDGEALSQALHQAVVEDGASRSAEMARGLTSMAATTETAAATKATSAAPSANSGSSSRNSRGQ